MSKATLKNDIIVIGGDNTGTLNVIRSLGEREVPIIAIITGERTSFIKTSKYIKKSWIVKEKEEDILEVLIDKVRIKEEKLTILPTSDFATQVVDSNLNLLKDNFIFPNIEMKQGEISKNMDKYYMTEKAKDAGLVVPTGITVNLNEYKVSEVINEMTYPCIIKPIDSVSGSKDFIKTCEDKDELRHYMNKLKKIKLFNEVLIQEYVTGSDVYMVELVGMVTHHGEIIMPGFFKKIRQCQNIKESTLQDGNTSLALLSGDRYGINFESMENFIRNLNYRGLFDIEFKVVDGVPYFIEINFRIGGTNYIYTYAGVNLPYIYYLDSYGEFTHSLYTPIKSEFTGIIEQRDIRNVFNGHISIFKFFRDFFKSDTKEIFNTTDLKPFFAYFIIAPRKIYQTYFQK